MHTRMTKSIMNGLARYKLEENERSSGYFGIAQSECDFESMQHAPLLMLKGTSSDLSTTCRQI